MSNALFIFKISSALFCQIFFCIIVAFQLKSVKTKHLTCFVSCGLDQLNLPSGRSNSLGLLRLQLQLCSGSMVDHGKSCTVQNATWIEQPSRARRATMALKTTFPHKTFLNIKIYFSTNSVRLFVSLFVCLSDYLSAKRPVFVKLATKYVTQQCG